MHGAKRGQLIKTIVGALWMIFIIFFVLFPTYWLIQTAIKPYGDIMRRPPVFFVTNPQFQSFVDVWTHHTAKFPLLLVNSIIISLSATFSALVLASLAALALTRLRFPGRTQIGLLAFVAYLVPSAMLFVPMYVLMARMGLNDTKLGLIVIYNSFTLPFSIWMLRGYFQSIPQEMEESALIDGCSRVGAWVRIVMPLAAPGMAAAAIFSFTNAWNEWLFAMILTESLVSRTAPLGLNMWIFLDMFFWGQLSAGALILAVPAVLMYFLGQRFIVAGLTGGAVKG
jgi:multiple sugar transport system permease protein